LTDAADHICFFRHALALDERRVKFLPEYVHGGTFYETEPQSGDEGLVSENQSERLTAGKQNCFSRPRVKEVWFAGTHSDM